MLINDEFENIKNINQQVPELFGNITMLPEEDSFRQNITMNWCRQETEIVPQLLSLAEIDNKQRRRILNYAKSLVQLLRLNSNGKSSLVQNLLQEFSLSSTEGVALMCLAEALLRIPDQQTRDNLIKDKVRLGNWHVQRKNNSSIFVNAVTWGLVITGKLFSQKQVSSVQHTFRQVLTKASEPMIRKAVNVAMKMMGEQFVMGERIEQALNQADKEINKKFRYSYDMLGEAAMTAEDAQRYLNAYENAIHAIGLKTKSQSVYDGPGISIKLSALHPRYYRNQIERVEEELYPVLKNLAELAARYNMGLNIDAEEAERLDISLNLFERLCFEPELKDWQGLGFVVQAYQKRAYAVVEYLIDLAKRSDRRIMLRLVKGAYWDTEIKKAQVESLDGYPVFTRKAYTDISYIACARKLLGEPKHIFPQFATHNAQTLATIYELADPENYWDGQYEFQCLYGMGEVLYHHVVEGANGFAARPCRVYAPVGTHETLLAYLARRLLENGANTSFVNQVADKTCDIDLLVKDPVLQVQEWAKEEGEIGLPHSKIPHPYEIYDTLRKNSKGLNFANESELKKLVVHLPKKVGYGLKEKIKPLSYLLNVGLLSTEPVVNPADQRDVLTYVSHVSKEQVNQTVVTAVRANDSWQQTKVSERAKVLNLAADSLEEEMLFFIGLLVREAGKSYFNAVAEVREAVDFLRYYSAQAKALFNENTHIPLGTVVCISPWNFPLAIFCGQIAAALVAGNTVIAKPAEQTPIVAAAMVYILHQAGIPKEVLQLVLGLGGQIGPLLTGHKKIKGVMFTGSTNVAKSIQKTIQNRLACNGQPIPLIAETGGQNAMIVDSSALSEQVVADVVQSAFDSAGQRCSALRVLYLQEEVADRLIAMIKGAMRELKVGNPMQLSTDVGPVIDQRAKKGIEFHVAKMLKNGKNVQQLQFNINKTEANNGSFVAPTIIELNSIKELENEVFGPVLHVVRYKREELDEILADINSMGYGLTFGIHTRIDETVERVVQQVDVGNVYVNRNMVGAVVGVQPFGGRGLSGTGPKAGGPIYLHRLLSKFPKNSFSGSFGVLWTSKEFSPEKISNNKYKVLIRELNKLRDNQDMIWAGSNNCDLMHTYELRGPTGEKNLYQLLGRKAVMCIADKEESLLTQLSLTLAAGAVAIWNAKCPITNSTYKQLSAEIKKFVILVDDYYREKFSLVLFSGEDEELIKTLKNIAEMRSEVIPVYSVEKDGFALPFMLQERAISIDTTAAGGNASLMTLE